MKPHAVRTEGSGTWDPAIAYGYETQLVHAGMVPDPTTGAILTPIYQSTTYIQDSVENYLEKGFSYTRSGNPTVRVFEDKIAALEGGFGGAAFGTGMAALVTVVTAFMKAGDHAVVTDCSYGGTNRACRVMFSKFGMEFTFVDMRDPKNVEAALKPSTRMVISETPANPTLTLTDLDAISAITQKRNILHVCDSTFCTPVIMKPLEHGVDIVLQSTTKYYDGHNMTVGGALVAKTKALHDEIKLYQNINGNIMTPMVAYTQLQTCKTMQLRVEKQSQTALLCAQMLEKHPKVERVMYPGLASFPQKALADRLHKRNLHGGMLWFEVIGGTESGRRIMNTIQRPWSLCENLGATESIITCPAVMTHANMLKEDRLKVGITDGFIRLSCGIEDAEDLVRALKTALDALL
jgi:cystathionine beta-lyase/cystathionine gamma-synthase